MEILREFRAVIVRRDAIAGLVLFVVIVFATGVRTRSGVISAGSSVAAVASSDDHTWYLAVVASMLAGSVSAAVFFDAGRFEYAWSAGATWARQLAARTSCGLLAGAVCGALYWLTRMASAAVSLALTDATVPGASGVLLADWGFVGRLVLVCVLMGGLGVAVGVATGRPTAAAGAALVLVVSLLPVFDLVAVRFPGLVRLQSLLPGGAATTVLESNAGLAKSSGLLTLRSGRSSWMGLLLLGAWAAALLAVGVVRRRRVGSLEPGVRVRVAKVVGSAIAVVSLAAMVLPVLARDALPWFLHPDWLYDSRRHRSSIDAVEDFVGKLQRGDAPDEVVDPTDPVWRPLRTGVVDIATEREMDEPRAVPVIVTEPGVPGLQYRYSFELTRGDDGWEVVRVGADVG